MKTLKILITLSIFVLSASVNSANLTHSYFFGSDYSDSTGSLPILNTGGSLSGGRYFYEGADGLTLNSALSNTSSYSIEMGMSTDVVFTGWNKLIDFQNRTSENGLYLFNSNLRFIYPIIIGADSVSPDTDFSVVVTVDSGVTSGYLNGVFQWSSLAADSVPASNILNFFLDDSVTGNTEAYPGSIDYLRIYEGALTPEEVGNLVPPAPNPNPAGNIKIFAIEGGGDVVITASGSIDLTGLIPYSNGIYTDGVVSPGSGEFLIGTAGIGTAYTGFSPTPVAPFGSGSPVLATDSTGLLVGILDSRIMVHGVYVSNAPLESSGTWVGESFASLGMDVGSYFYTLTNGQTVSLEITDDADGDGVTDVDDNCILVANPTQCDGDRDDYGNHCDADFNGDGITNGLDIGPMKTGFGTSDAVLDLNCDGIVNGLDIGPLKAMFGTAPGPSGLVP